MKKPSTTRRLGISAITVSGFKSLSKPTRIELRPLTILAGANSSGKSSIVQPLLLLKQTLEATYDPGGLLLDGANIRFTSAEQFLSQYESTTAKGFSLAIEVGDGVLTLKYEKRPNLGVVPVTMHWRFASRDVRLALHMTHEQTFRRLPDHLKSFGKSFAASSTAQPRWRITQRRGVLGFELLFLEAEDGLSAKRAQPIPPMVGVSGILEQEGALLVQNEIRGMIHVPGLRGNPERSYRSAGVHRQFPGTFEPYVAGLINRWTQSEPKKLRRLVRHLRSLGLAWDVGVQEVDDTRVQVYVSRLPRAVRGDLDTKNRVSIADVGFGVSQALPVLVALLAAEPGQLVHIEQPEIHLHPKAQYALASIIAEAVKRKVQVVIETHSSLLLLAIQTLVAERRLSAKSIKLHWFTRRSGGSTVVQSADLDKTGAFGDWPEDFAGITLHAEHRYLKAAAAGLFSHQSFVEEDEAHSS